MFDIDTLLIAFKRQNIFFFQIRYRALIEKVASTQEVHVLYVDFGNVSLSIVTVYCSLIGGFMSSSFWLLPPLLP